MRVTLIDADSIVWGIAYFNKDKTPIGSAIGEEVDICPAIDESISQILHATKATHYIGLLQGAIKSKRNICFETYKANRPGQPDWFVLWRPVILNRLIYNWNFVRVDAYEVDDAIASIAANMRRKNEEYVIASIDKDLKQIPGEHYNYRTMETMVVEQWQAERNLALQLLTGDQTDNVKGVKGIGPKKAEKILNTDLPIPDSYEPIVMKIVRQYAVQNESSMVMTLIDFAENILQLTLREDVYEPGSFPTPVKIKTE